MCIRDSVAAAAAAGAARARVHAALDVAVARRVVQVAGGDDQLQALRLHLLHGARRHLGRVVGRRRAVRLGGADGPRLAEHVEDGNGERQAEVLHDVRRVGGDADDARAQVDRRAGQTEAELAVAVGQRLGGRLGAGAGAAAAAAGAGAAQRVETNAEVARTASDAGHSTHARLALSTRLTCAKTIQANACINLLTQLGVRRISTSETGQCH